MKGELTRGLMTMAKKLVSVMINANKVMNSIW